MQPEDRLGSQALSLPPIAEWYDARTTTAFEARPTTQTEDQAGQRTATAEGHVAYHRPRDLNGAFAHPDSLGNTNLDRHARPQQSFPTQLTGHGLPKVMGLPEHSAMPRRDSSLAGWTVTSPGRRGQEGLAVRPGYESIQSTGEEADMSARYGRDCARYAAASHGPEEHDDRIKQEYERDRQSFDPVSRSPHLPLTHESLANRADDSLGNPTILQYVPGLLPAAAGYKNRGYIGVEMINGQKFHIYEGGLCLPYEVNGERVNEWWGLTKANIPRKRLATACDRCREKKVRCEPGVGGCLQCQRVNSTCLR
jgi:hypothetical protein